MAVHTLQDLKQMQALPLSVKIRMTEQRIRDWVYEYGEDGVYVSFSGGKDSTVLLDIVRNVCGFKNVPAVFCDTGLEYPEIREFVKKFDNVVWLKPKMTFKQIINKYGYPFFGKETADVVSYAVKYLEKRAKEVGWEGSLLELAESTDKWEMPYRVSVVLGTFESFWEKKKKGILPKDGELSRARFQQKRYKFMLDANFRISPYCCNVMKKNPMKLFEKETGRKPISGQMAEESVVRRNKWLMFGCNGFQMQHPISNPMSFWTEQDVLKYIKTYGTEICSVYGQVVPDEKDSDDRQITVEDLGLMPDNRRLKTTGCSRTGCMFCGFGCHLNNDDRFVRMKETHPQLYDYIMRPEKDGGLNFKEVIDWINEHGNMNIRY